MIASRRRADALPQARARRRLNDAGRDRLQVDRLGAGGRREAAALGADELGHESLSSRGPAPAPGPSSPPRPPTGLSPVWDQPGITEASDHDVPLSQVKFWVPTNSIEAVLCDENYQFDQINHLREQGVRTIGRFVLGVLR